jgi:hypothetical protein
MERLRDRERTGERLRERTGERLRERTGERLGERTGERLRERTGERLGERTGERLRERTGERTGERTSEREGERAFLALYTLLSPHLFLNSGSTLKPILLCHALFSVYLPAPNPFFRQVYLLPIESYPGGTTDLGPQYSHMLRFTARPAIYVYIL